MVEAACVTLRVEATSGEKACTPSPNTRAARYFDYRLMALRPENRATLSTAYAVAPAAPGDQARSRVAGARPRWPGAPARYTQCAFGHEVARRRVQRVAMTGPPSVAGYAVHRRSRLDGPPAAREGHTRAALASPCLTQKSPCSSARGSAGHASDVLFSPGQRHSSWRGVFIARRAVMAEAERRQDTARRCRQERSSMLGRRATPQAPRIADNGANLRERASTRDEDRQQKNAAHDGPDEDAAMASKGYDAEWSWPPSASGHACTTTGW